MKKKNIYYFRLVIVSLIIFCLGLVLGYFLFRTGNENLDQIRINNNYNFINPLLECDASYSLGSNQLNHLKERVEDEIFQDKDADLVNSVSVYYRELNNGAWFGINEKDVFSPASLIKVPILMAYLKEVQDNPEILNKKVIVDEPYEKFQYIPPKKTIKMGGEYTIEELLETMIIYSDNYSYNILLNNIGSEKIFKVFNDVGIDIQKYNKENPGGDIISVKDYSSFFRILFNASYLNEEMSEKALSILNRVDFKDGLVSGVGFNIPVAHKFGERRPEGTSEKQFHDCGIIYLPGRPYLLCVMTRGENTGELVGVVGDVSKTVYDYLVSE